MKGKLFTLSWLCIPDNCGLSIVAFLIRNRTTVTYIDHCYLYSSTYIDHCYRYSSFKLTWMEGKLLTLSWLCIPDSCGLIYCCSSHKKLQSGRKVVGPPLSLFSSIHPITTLNLSFLSIVRWKRSPKLLSRNRIPPFPPLVSMLCSTVPSVPVLVWNPH